MRGKQFSDDLTLAWLMKVTHERLGTGARPPLPPPDPVRLSLITCAELCIEEVMRALRRHLLTLKHIPPGERSELAQQVEQEALDWLASWQRGHHERKEAA